MNIKGIDTECYVAEDVIFKGNDNFSSDVVLSGESHNLYVRIFDSTYKYYFDKYYRKFFSVVSVVRNYSVIIVPPYKNMSDYKKVQIGVGNCITVYQKGYEVFIVCE